MYIIIIQIVHFSGIFSIYFLVYVFKRNLPYLEKRIQSPMLVEFGCWAQAIGAAWAVSDHLQADWHPMHTKNSLYVFILCFSFGDMLRAYGLSTKSNQKIKTYLLLLAVIVNTLFAIVTYFFNAILLFAFLSSGIPHCFWVFYVYKLYKKRIIFLDPIILIIRFSVFAKLAKHSHFWHIFQALCPLLLVGLQSYGISKRAVKPNGTKINKTNPQRLIS